MGLFSNPLSYAGYAPGVTGTPTTQNTTVRAATATEAAAGTLDNVYISPATEQSSVVLDFASPPVGGFGSTTPRPVAATTLTSSGTSSIATGAGTTANIGNATGTIGFFGATAVSKPASTDDLRTALINLGLYTTGGASPLNLNGGALTAGDITAAGNILDSKSAAGVDLTLMMTNSDNTNAASRAGIELATGGASSGDPYLSFQISGVGASTMTMGLDNSASDLFVISNSTSLGTSNALTLSQAGALTATTTVTATLGDITATNGNIVRGTAGNKDVYTSVAASAAAGANSAGTVTLVGGTATVSTTAVTASSIVRLYRQGVGATGAAALGILTLGTVTASTSFVINAVQAADATALQASDVSIVAWEIVN